MSSVATEIDVPVEETEAFQVVAFPGGPADRQDPRGGCGPPCAGMCPAAGMADAGRGDGCRGAAAGVGPAGQAAGGSAAGGGAAAGVVRHPPPRLRLPALSHRPARGRPDRGPMRLSRLPQELAGHLQAHAGRARAPPRPAAALATGTEGAGVERAPCRERPVLGSDSPADGPRRLAGARRLEGRRRDQSQPIGAGRTGTASGSVRARTASRR